MKEELTKEEQQELIELCKALLNGANRCSQKPFYIVQPFVGIVQKHRELIKELNLL